MTEKVTVRTMIKNLMEVFKMKFHRSYHHKYWFGLMWITGYRSRMFGSKVIHMVAVNSSFNYMRFKVLPRCWLDK